MRKRSLLLIVALIGGASILFQSCSSSSDKNNSEKEGPMISRSNGGDQQKEQKADKEGSEGETPESIKEGKGVGPVKEVELTDPLKEEWVKKGKSIHGKKCASCHKLNDQRAVGPGWAGITNRRKPEWIMNMIMNTDVMLTEDPEARRQLEECMTRMPNQNLSRENARKVVEFMRKNDVEKTGKKDQA